MPKRFASSTTYSESASFLVGLCSMDPRAFWKNEIVEHDYCWTISFTRDDLRDESIRVAATESAEADVRDHLHAV